MSRATACFDSLMHTKNQKSMLSLRWDLGVQRVKSFRYSGIYKSDLHYDEKQSSINDHQ